MHCARGLPALIVWNRFHRLLGGEVWGVSVAGVFFGTITVGCEPVLEIVGLLVRRVFISVSLS